jgi:hypothetical protein
MRTTLDLPDGLLAERRGFVEQDKDHDRGDGLSTW